MIKATLLPAHGDTVESTTKYVHRVVEKLLPYINEQANKAGLDCNVEYSVSATENSTLTKDVQIILWSNQDRQLGGNSLLWIDIQFFSKHNSLKGTVQNVKYKRLALDVYHRFAEIFDNGGYGKYTKVLYK